MRARVEHELGEVGRALAAHRGDRLAHLERVADRAPERLVHVRQHADDLAPRTAAEREHRLGERPRVASVFMNAPSPTLTSSTIASAPAAIFFDMMLAAISETLSTVAVTSRSA